MQIPFNTAFIAHFIATQIVHNIGHGFEGRLAHPIAQNTIFYFPHSPSFSSKTTSFHSCSFFCLFSLQDHQRHHIPRLEADGSYTIVPLYNGHLGERRKWTLRGGRCREVETRVNVWTIRQKKGYCRVVAVVKKEPLVEEDCTLISTLFFHPTDVRGGLNR